jgi:hypothetical protein
MSAGTSVSGGIGGIGGIEVMEFGLLAFPGQLHVLPSLVLLE